MVAWAAVIPALKAAAPWIAKAGGAALSFMGSKNLFGGGDNEPEGSGITYNAQVPNISVQGNNNGSLYSQITGTQPQMFGNSLYNRLMR